MDAQCGYPVHSFVSQNMCIWLKKYEGKQHFRQN